MIRGLYIWGLLGTCNTWNKHDLKLNLRVKRKVASFVCLFIWSIRAILALISWTNGHFSNRICYCSIQFHQFRRIGQQQQATVTVLYFRMLLFTERSITAIYRTLFVTAASFTNDTHYAKKCGRFWKDIAFIYLFINLFIWKETRALCINFMIILFWCNWTFLLKKNTNFEMWLFKRQLCWIQNMI